MVSSTQQDNAKIFVVSPYKPGPEFMSADELREYYMCLKKRQYETEALAWIGVRETVEGPQPKVAKPRRGQPLEPYECPHCRKWHIGRDRTGVPRPLRQDGKRRITKGYIMTILRYAEPSKLDNANRRWINDWAWRNWFKSQGRWTNLVFESELRFKI